MVLRASCGGGYGDGGQHEQSLWGWLAHIPGLVVAVPSVPADAGGLMTSALSNDGPVVFLEHKLLSESWLEFLGRGGRSTVSFDVPSEGARGLIPDIFEAIPFGKAVSRREGRDITMVSIAVGVHRCLEAAKILEETGIQAGVIDLRTVAPLDRESICEAVSASGRLLVVDEDYRDFGLSGEAAATLSERGIPFKYGRVCTEMTIPYCREREDAMLPGTKRILEMAQKLLE
jgi:pyruvate dehydrogenase E1 component beta subunit